MTSAPLWNCSRTACRQSSGPEANPGAPIDPMSSSGVLSVECPPSPVINAPAGNTRGPGMRFSATHTFSRNVTSPFDPTSRTLVIPLSMKYRSFSTARSVASASFIATPISSWLSGYVRWVCKSIRPGRTVFPETSTTCASFGQSVEPGGRIFTTLFLSITSELARAGAPVPSKILPLRRTTVPSGPRGPGFTTVRRGSSLTGVFGSRNFLRPCAFSCVQPCEPKSKRKTIRPSAFVFILPSSTDDFLSQFHALWAAQRGLRAPRWSRAGRNLSNLFCPNPLLRSFFLLFCFRKLLGPQSKRLQHFVLALGPQHFHGLFHGPWRCKTLRPVRNPVSRQRHQRGVLRQHVWVHRFQRVGCRVMREFVLGRILIHVDSRQSGHRKGQRVRSTFHFVGHANIPNRRKRPGKRLKARHQIVSPS